jgi:hypothetical protein
MGASARMSSPPTSGSGVEHAAASTSRKGRDPVAATVLPSRNRCSRPWILDRLPRDRHQRIRLGRRRPPRRCRPARSINVLDLLPRPPNDPTNRSSSRGNGPHPPCSLTAHSAPQP